MRQLLDALCYLHKYKIIYNGLKCSNILSDTHGLIKLGDFHDARDHGAGDSVNGYVFVRLQRLSLEAS